MDRFASSNNAKTKLFNSLYWIPGYLGVNSFNYDWLQDVNRLIPLVPLASRAINHLVKCKSQKYSFKIRRKFQKIYVLSRKS